MKTVWGFQKNAVCLLGGLSLVATALAEPEQWLNYRTTTDSHSAHQLTLSTNPPAGVALPALSAPSYFVRWETPLDPAGGRWICLDRKRKAGLCDRLYIDSNGNGRLDDETPVEARERDEYSSTFPPVKVVLKGEDGPVTYHLVCRFMEFRGPAPYLQLEPGGYYEGTVLFDGKKKRIELHDGNVNGVFNDLCLTGNEGDRIQVDGEMWPEHYLGRYVEVGKKLYEIEVARDGAFVKVKPAANVAVGTVRVPAGLTELTALGENGHFMRSPTNGELTLPAGKYHVNSWTVSRPDDKGVMWQLQGAYPEKFDFEVTADKPALVEAGEPISARLSATETSTRVAFDLQLSGAHRERVQMMQGSSRPKPPQLIVRSADGSYASTNAFEYG